jgi:prevent-host-death family protein
MNEIINLAEARRKLPELTDKANSGQTYVLSRRGREIAVLIGIEEYQRLMTLERQQRQQDYDILLAPPGKDSLTEDEAHKLAERAVREVRAKS